MLKMFKLTKTLIGMAVVVGGWALTSWVVAQTTAPAAAPFAVYHVGNSLTGDLLTEFRTIAAAHVQETQDQFYRWGVHFRPATALSFIHDYPTAPQSSSVLAKNAKNYAWKQVGTPDFVPWTAALPGNHWDVVTLQPWQDDSKATLKSDTAAINDMIAQTRKRPDNAHTRFFIYGPWTVSKFNEFDSFSKAFLTPTPNTPAQLATPTRDYFRHVTAAVRQSNPQVALIPTGEVMVALDLKMRAGKFEHFTSVQQLHRDVIHLNSAGQNVTAWTAYATIFKKSPVGLSNTPHKDQDYPPFQNVMEISPADLKLIQETIWEVVTAPDLCKYTNVP